MIGFGSKVTYDDAERHRSTTDAIGRVTSKEKNVKDQLLRTIDSAGRVSTTVHDAQDRPTDTYGPAPGHCFIREVPTAACAGIVPREHTNYDEGINGLSASYFDNPDLAGAPKVYGTGIGAADGRVASPWEYANSPINGIAGDAFSLRLTGEVVFPAVGDFKLRAYVDDGIRMWVDDQLVIDDWRVTNPAWREATVRSADFASVAGLVTRYGLTTSTIARRQTRVLRQAQDGDPDDPFTQGLRSTYNELETQKKAALASIADLDTDDDADPKAPHTSAASPCSTPCPIRPSILPRRPRNTSDICSNC